MSVIIKNCIVKNTLIRGFKPSDVKGRFIHLDASNPDNVVLSDDNIEYLLDISGNGNDFSQPTALNRPLYDLGKRKGKNVVNFDGIEDTLFALFSEIPQPFTMLVVANISNIISTNEFIFDGVPLNKKGCFNLLQQPMDNECRK